MLLETYKRYCLLPTFVLTTRINNALLSSLLLSPDSIGVANYGCSVIFEIGDCQRRASVIAHNTSHEHFGANGRLFDEHMCEAKFTHTHKTDEHRVELLL